MVLAHGGIGGPKRSLGSGGDGGDGGVISRPVPCLAWIGTMGGDGGDGGFVGRHDCAAARVATAA